MCVSFSGNQNVSELFKFQGDFRIIGIKIVNKDLDLISCFYNKLDIDYFNLSQEIFSSGGSYFSYYNSIHEAISTSEDIDIYRNDLFTKQDEFYYENGDNYFGSYHQHSNGQAMSESSHTFDSVKIFRKDQNNKLYKPKSKRLKTITITDEAGMSREEKELTDIKVDLVGESLSGTTTTGTGGSTGGGGVGY